ncbi:MAG: hypothetical protein M0C28_33545 [Candidatus Moduliflexus flocculans]|nr:hypothetical protein [Candidatus Moduliflexus flocculans]
MIVEVRRANQGADHYLMNPIRLSESFRMRWVKLGFSTRRRESYTSIWAAVMRPRLRLMLAAAFRTIECMSPSPASSSRECGAFIFRQRFVHLFEPFQRGGAVADGDPLPFQVAGFLKDGFGAVGGL